MNLEVAIWKSLGIYKVSLLRASWFLKRAKDIPSRYVRPLHKIPPKIRVKLGHRMTMVLGLLLTPVAVIVSQHLCQTNLYRIPCIRRCYWRRKRSPQVAKTTIPNANASPFPRAQGIIGKPLLPLLKIRE